MKRLLYIGLLAALIQGTRAQSIAPERQWLWEGPVQQYSDYFEFNPAATFALPDKHYGTLGADYHWSAADETMHPVQDGDGSEGLKLSTKSYHRSGRQAFFGDAAFVSDKRSNVQWCDNEDRNLLNPYLIGDSIGGDYYREAYSMGGGTSLRTGSWEWGIRGSYRGSVSYRKVDPRPRNTVSALRINPGFTYSHGAWRMGWYGQYERYRQNVDIQVEKEGRKEYFYLLQGFGIYNRQFSELDESYTRLYKGYLMSSGIHLNFAPSATIKSGLRLGGQRDRLQASESDRRTPYAITRNGLNAEITHQQLLFGKTLLFRAGYDFLQTIGNETQYTPSTIQGNYIVWNFATQSDRYEQGSEQMGLSLAVIDPDVRKTFVWGQLELNRSQVNQFYYVPDYQQLIQDRTMTATIGLHAPFRKSCLDAELLGGFRQVVFSDLYQAENTVPAQRLVLPDYAYWSGDRSFYQLKLKYIRGAISATLSGGIQQRGSVQAVQVQGGCALNF